MFVHLNPVDTHVVHTSVLLSRVATLSECLLVKKRFRKENFTNKFFIRTKKLTIESRGVQKKGVFNPLAKLMGLDCTLH